MSALVSAVPVKVLVLDWVLVLAWVRVLVRKRALVVVLTIRVWKSDAGLMSWMCVVAGILGGLTEMAVAAVVVVGAGFGGVEGGGRAGGA